MDHLVQAGVTLVWDAAKGYAIKRTLVPGFDAIWEHLKVLLFPRWDAAYSEVQSSVARAFDSAEKGDTEFINRLRRSFEAGEADSVLTRLLCGAAQATTHERMRMLAAAAAGVLVPDLESEMRSRIVRSIEQLEPSDVKVLRWALSVGPPSGPPLKYLPDGPEANSGLFQAGCLLMGGGGMSFGHVFEITTLGHAVLRTLDQWQPSGG